MGWKKKKNSQVDEKQSSTDLSSLTTSAAEGYPFHLPSNAPKSPTTTQPRNPFATPGSAPGTPGGVRTPGTPAGARTPGSLLRASTTAFQLPASKGKTYFKSRRIRDVSSIAKPWTEVRDPKKKWHTIFPLSGIALGIALVGLEVWQGMSTVTNNKYCSIYDLDFGAGGTLDPNIWTKEIQVGGFGVGDFAETTDSDENVFIRDGQLIIKPTLQDENLVNTNSVMDLLKDGTCTSTRWADCYAVTNTTNGTIVNPVKSARLNTKKGMSIQYGRVEVTAAIPQGDWMWPAIWLMPVEDTYGAWPASGEIDIMESRGNNWTYPLGGNDIMSSALHWGPNTGLDSWYRTFIKRNALHTTFAETYHTFGLEWSEKYLFTYVDNRLLQALYVPFDGPMWPKGHFDPSTSNGTLIVDPWSQTGRPSTPFDQSFYLILNVAVGGTNGWFQDGMQGKPWVDASPSSKLDFWKAKDEWYPTWQEKGEFRIKSVKMWQQAGYKGC